MYLSRRPDRGRFPIGGNPGLMVSHIILGSSLSGGPGRLGASPLERGGEGVVDGSLLAGTQIQSLRMSCPLDGVSGSGSC
jgi:hypothetical protein